MREIKFRAWDKERKDMRMITLMDWREWWVTTEEVEDMGAHPLEFGERNSFGNSETDRHILMQYTGLKDRNGKEIYEGDIIRCGDMPIYEAEVMYDDNFGAWGLCRDQVMSCHVGDYDEQDREVIGNIYENPELIGGGADARTTTDTTAEADHRSE